MSLKNCGNCTGCCGPCSLHVEGVFEPWTRCPHARRKTCAIYKDRPQECRDFQCMWTGLSPWPSELRPDRCGFMGIMQETESKEHLDVVFCETPPGVKPRLLADAIVLVLEDCRRVTTTRLTLLYGGQDREPKVEIDVPFHELSDRLDEDIALEILEVWGFQVPAKTTPAPAPPKQG